MVAIRSAASALLLSLIAPAVFASSSAAAPVTATTLSGVVRDDVGGVLEGVEVLVLAPEGNGGGALLSAISDVGGRFVVGAITPGVYRVAAIKSGYIAALLRVNTLLRSSVELVLRPVPKAGQLGAERVLDDLSWTLRTPPRSVLRELEAGAVLSARDSGGARAFAARMQDSVRGEVDHMVALGSWRPGSSGPSSNLEGNETRMRFAGTLGERGAIQLHGRRGSFESASQPSSAFTVSRGTSDVDLDMFYDTSVDQSLAMRAFYSTGDLAVGDRPGLPGSGARQWQRSWGYDATWRRQVDAASHVALQVGLQDANLDLGQGNAVGWDVAQGNASNRAIGAEGSYDSVLGDRHLMRLGVRAQRLSLSDSGARLGRASGAFALDGATGWSLLIDSQDQWSVAGPVAVNYGLALRQGFDGSQTTLAPRIGGAWTVGLVEARAEVSYFATTGSDPGGAGVSPPDHRSPYGYKAQLQGRLHPTLILRGTASYVPSQASVWGGQQSSQEFSALYIDDGFASDRFVTIDLEHVGSTATVAFRVARGRAEGALAPALDDVPVVILSDRALDYDAARLGVKAPRAGSAVSLEYRAIREYAAVTGVEATDLLRTVSLEFAQDVVRFAGGRASCRFLLTARSALGSGAGASQTGPIDTRPFVAEYKRIGAGVSLAF